MSRHHLLSQPAFLCFLACLPLAGAAPIANNDSFFALEDTPLTQAGPGLLQNDDPNGATGTLSAVKVTDPAHGTVSIQADGSFTYTPAANYFGPDSFQYKVSAGAGPITFTVNQTTSELTIDVDTDVASPGTSDSQTTHAKAKGTITTLLTPAQSPFGIAHVRGLNLALAEQASVSMVVFKVFGQPAGWLDARIESDGLLITMREDQAGPAVPVTAGKFSQTGNLIDTTGTIFLSTRGAATFVEVPPSAELNSTNVSYDLNNASITQTGNTLNLAVPLDMTQTITDPQYTATIHVHGTIYATAPVPAAAVDSNIATVTLDVSSVDDEPVAADDRYYTRQNHRLTVPATAGAPVQQTLIPQGSVWKYKTGTDLGTGWRAPEFNDSTWDTAAGPLGYDTDIPPASTIPARANMALVASQTNPNYPTAYFRREFTLTNPFDTITPTVEFQRDDACVIYVNGVEIYRDSTAYATGGVLPFPLTGEVGYDTYAAANIPEADSLAYKSVTFSRSLLREGRNVIAAEVHQNTATSSDLRFDLRALRTTGVGGVAANDTDVDGPAYNIVLHAPPAHGTLNLSADGSFVYTPEPGYPASGASATDSFVYRHTNGGQPYTTSAILLPMSSANWKYLDNGTAAPQDAGITAADWRNAGFNDSAWGTGAAELGYGDDDEATIVQDNATAGYNSADTDRYITTYFRRKFDYNGSTALLNSLKVRVIRDDAVVIWLNGVRIVKDGLPTTWNHLTPASTGISGAAETTPLEVLDIPAAALRQGENILAVEIHQQAANSSDISFNMELSAVSVVGGRVDIVVLNDDLDNDNVSDTWERSFSIDATVANAEADADSDGSSNRAEFLAGTNPLQAGSRLRASAVADAGGSNLQITFDSVPGRTYHLQRSDALGAWLDIGADFPAHSTAAETTVMATKPAQQEKAFFRVRLVGDWQ